MTSSLRPPAEVPAPSPPQRRALGIIALASVAALGYLALPVGSGLFFGTLLAFSLLRVYDRLAARLRNPGLAALVLVIASGLAIVSFLTLLVYSLVAQVVIAANSLARSAESQGALNTILLRLRDMTKSSPLGPVDVAGQVNDALSAIAAQLATLPTAIAGATFSAVLTLFFTVLTAFFVLRHWREIVAALERSLPLHPMHTRIVLIEFQKMGKEVFVGTALTGMIQGILGGVSYALAGVPEAVLLGALTAVSSLVPLIGTALVWIPVGIGMMLAGHTGAGLFVLVWGTVLVGLGGEYIVRPRLVGGRGHVPALITFISLFGGVQVFGLPGLIFGPVIASVALAILRTYDRALHPVDQEIPIP